MASLIAHVTGGSPSGNDFTTGAIDTSGAIFLVAAITDYTGATQATLSDSKGNTWTPRTTYTEVVSGTRLRLFYVASATVGTSHDFTVTSTSGFPAIAVAAFSGIATISPYQVENGTSSTVTTSVQPGSITPSVSNSLVISALGWDNALTSLGINSSFSISDQTNAGGNNFGIALAYLDAVSGAINPTWSWTTSRNVAATIASFSPATVLPGDEGFAWYMGSRR